jgi:hypothetical protein
MLGAKPIEESAQQQLVKIIPAAVLDTLFRNSLRVGMAAFLLFADFDFRFDRPDGPTYTPKAVPRERTCSLSFI